MTYFVFYTMMLEIDNGKMRVFLSDVVFDTERDGKGGCVSIPFGKADCTVFRKVMSTEDMIHEFALTLRTEAQARSFRVAMQTLGNLSGSSSATSTSRTSST